MSEKSMKSVGMVLSIVFALFPTFSHAATLAELPLKTGAGCYDNSVFVEKDI